AILVTIMNTVTKNNAESMMAGVDPATITQSSAALITQKALLEGIQYSFYVTLAINIIALVLAFFVKRADTSESAVKELEKQSNATTKPATN
ncbi:MFS transporter, partial [Niallia taxi]